MMQGQEIIWHAVEYKMQQDASYVKHGYLHRLMVNNIKIHHSSRNACYPQYIAQVNSDIQSLFWFHQKILFSRSVKTAAARVNIDNEKHVQEGHLSQEVTPRFCISHLIDVSLIFQRLRKVLSWKRFQQHFTKNHFLRHRNGVPSTSFQTSVSNTTDFKPGLLLLSSFFLAICQS